MGRLWRNEPKEPPGNMAPRQRRKSHVFEWVGEPREQGKSKWTQSIEGAEIEKDYLRAEVLELKSVLRDIREKMLAILTNATNKLQYRNHVLEWQSDASTWTSRWRSLSSSPLILQVTHHIPRTRTSPALICLGACCLMTLLARSSTAFQWSPSRMDVESECRSISLWMDLLWYQLSWVSWSNVPSTRASLNLCCFRVDLGIFSRLTRSIAHSLIFTYNYCNTRFWKYIS